MPKPRRHHHLSREAIARTALKLVDAEGVDALTIRRLAQMLHVGATNLYTYFPDRENIVRDVVALLLAEVELPEDSGAPWDEALLSVCLSYRDMALRHPRAFILVVEAPIDEWPVVEHGRRLHQFRMRNELPSLTPALTRAIDSYVEGFVLVETQSLIHTRTESWNPFPESSEFSAAYAVPNTTEMFEQGYRMIVAGFQQLQSTAAAELEA